MAVTGSSSHRHGGTPHSPGTMVTVTMDTQVTPTITFALSYAKQFWNTVKYLEVSQERAINNQQLDGKLLIMSWTKQTCWKIIFLHVSMYHCHPHLAPICLLNTWICWGECWKICRIQRRMLCMNPLQYIDVSKANGQDRISGKMLKPLHQALLPQSLSCWICQFQLAVSPTIWTLSNNLLTKEYC